MIRLNKGYPPQKQSKNRSSKHLKWLTGYPDPLRCVSMEVLQRWASHDVNGAAAELARRQARYERRKAK